MICTSVVAPAGLSVGRWLSMIPCQRLGRRTATEDSGAAVVASRQVADISSGPGRSVGSGVFGPQQPQTPALTNLYLAHNTKIGGRDGASFITTNRNNTYHQQTNCASCCGRSSVFRRHSSPSFSLRLSRFHLLPTLYHRVHRHLLRRPRMPKPDGVLGAVTENWSGIAVELQWNSHGSKRR